MCVVCAAVTGVAIGSAYVVKAIWPKPSPPTLPLAVYGEDLED